MLPVWFLRSRSPDWFAGRGRPPQAAARRAGLEGVEKVSQLPQQHGHDGAERRHAALLRPRRTRCIAGRAGSWRWHVVVLVVVAVVHRMANEAEDLAVVDHAGLATAATLGCRSCGGAALVLASDRIGRPGLAGRSREPATPAERLIGTRVTAGQGRHGVTIRRLLRAALTVPLLFGGLLLATAGPAVACSCAIVRSEADRAARADAVFVGTLVSQATQIDYKARELMASPDPAVRIRALRNDTSRIVWTFQVSRVYKGAVGKRQEIVTPAGTDCGGLGVGRGTEPSLVFAYKPAGDRSRAEPGQYASSLCSGSRPLADGGAPVLGWPWAGEPGWPDSAVGVGVLAAGVAAGLGLAALRARRRASAD
jgi:hypothetical protein